jgi:hypothetical protein
LSTAAVGHGPAAGRKAPAVAGVLATSVPFRFMGATWSEIPIGFLVMAALLLLYGGTEWCAVRARRREAVVV